MYRRHAGARFLPRVRSDLRVFDYDRMRRDVAVEVVRDGTVTASGRASVPRGGNYAWREAFDAAGRYRVTVSLRYGPTEPVECRVEHPDRDSLDVIVAVDGIDAVPGRRRV
jgi:hypothetical protein